MTALHRTVALKQVNHVALGVAKHLNFNVTRSGDVALNQHRVVAKTVDGFAFARCQSRVKFSRAVDGPHAFAATARAGFDEHRVTNAVGLALEHRSVLIGTVVTRHQRHPSALHQLLGFSLQAHGFQRRWRRADEDQASVGTGLSKLGVLAQKTVAGVNGLRARGERRSNDAVAAQVAFFWRCRTDAHGFVASQHVLGIGVGV
jgi:hypothetical protein